MALATETTRRTHTDLLYRLEVVGFRRGEDKRPRIPQCYRIFLEFLGNSLPQVLGCEHYYITLRNHFLPSAVAIYELEGR